MEGDQAEDGPGDQQDVQRVEPTDDHLTGELTAEEQEHHPGTDDRDGLGDRVGDPQAGAGQQVVRQGVAGEALEDAEHEQPDPDDPVELTGLAERAGEEHPGQVHHDRGHEQQGCPVVDLTHDQAAADIEADVQRRGVGLGHRDAAQRDVAAVVDDLTHAGVVEQR